MKFKILTIAMTSIVLASCVQQPPTVYKTKHTIYVKDKYVKKSQVVGVQNGQTAIIPSNSEGLYTGQ